MSAIDVTPGSRLYVQDAAEYGDAVRINILGLANTPVITLDGGSTVSYFGPNRAKVVDASKKQSLITGALVSLPVDVKMVGRDQLNALGIPADKQTAMFSKWIALSDAQRTQFLSTWNGLNKSDADEVRQFVQSMVEALLA
jgi:hypothetical protein